MRNILEVAAGLGLSCDDLILYGQQKAKIKLSAFSSRQKKGKYILVSAITPTKFGEGKTLTTIGLSMALNSLGKKAVSCIRQPSLGPYLGVKGGGTGGGKCRALPEDDINLHFTGDNYAVSAAHNFVASVIDNHLFRGNELGFDLSEINWMRVSDVSDGALREIQIGLNWGHKSIAFPRKSGYAITAASELMSILALSNNIDDFKQKLSSVVLGFSKNKQPITAQDMSLSGAMFVLLKDALMPNLVQTSEGTPCIVHTGPFANISIGSSSIIADKIALNLADYVVTESGFGMDCGGEKFFHIKSRAFGHSPDLIVLVVTVRAFKEYGENNLRIHIENAKSFNRPVLVCINHREEDAKQDLLYLREKAIEYGANEVGLSDMWALGSEGGMDLAEKAVMLTNKASGEVAYTYDLADSIQQKIEKLAVSFYRASEVEFSDIAREKIKLFEGEGYSHLPICVAKTQFSIGYDKTLGPSPESYVFKVNDAFLSAGAGFVVLLCGNISVLPGLPSHPRGLDF